MAENRQVFRVKDANGTLEQVNFETRADQVNIDAITGLTATEVQTALEEIYTTAKNGGVTGVKGSAETNYRTGNVNITKANIGLGSVDNTSDSAKPVSSATQTALNAKVDKTTTVNGHALSANVSVTKSDVGLGSVTNDAQVKRSEMGKASGVATLGTDGKVPTSQLPSYVDDVVEYDSKSAFPSTGEAGKIYVDKATNKTYRWGGSAYVEISASLALGETSSTAYAGNKGKANADAISALQTKTSTMETDLSGKANLAGGNTFTGNQDFDDISAKAINGSSVYTKALEIGSPFADDTARVKLYGYNESDAEGLREFFFPNYGGTLALYSDVTTEQNRIDNIVNGTTKVGKASSADTATKLANARTISLSGDASGSTTFDGSANKTISVTLANTGVTAGTYTALTVDAKGRALAGGQAIEWGTAGQATPSPALMVGGLFFKLK